MRQSAAMFDPEMGGWAKEGGQPRGAPLPARKVAAPPLAKPAKKVAATANVTLAAAMNRKLWLSSAVYAFPVDRQQIAAAVVEIERGLPVKEVGHFDGMIVDGAAAAAGAAAAVYGDW